MKRITLTTLTLILGNTLSFSQWLQRSSCDGGPRSFSTGFTIGNKIYVFGGSGTQGYLDLWEYDVTVNNWTQKLNFPGGARAGAVAFTIGNKAYMGLGTDNSIFYDDLWEYTPTNDSWAQKANFPGGGRKEAVGFSIGNLGYVGTGQLTTSNLSSTITTAYDDFYNYDPLTNTWTQLSNVPVQPRTFAVGCSAGGKGYLGFGTDANMTTSFSDFYEYDPVLNVWKTKSSGYPAGDAGMFSIGTDVFLFGGINFANWTGAVACRRYNTLTDNWSSMADFPGGIIASPVSVTANGKGYVGTGFDSLLIQRNDWWQFTGPASTTVATPIVETFSSSGVNLYPNPFTTEINISLKNNISQEASLFFITNTLGEEVFSGFIEKSSTASQKIPLPESLDKGFYTLTLASSQRKKIALRKIIKE
jgi:N-acetylneuraminic acid mutarotase